MKSFFTSLVACVMLFSMKSFSSEQNTTTPYEVVELSSKYIVGLEVRTSNQPGQAEKDIPLLWEQFFQSGGTQQIPGKIDGDIIALYSGYEGDYTEPYSVVIGSEVSSCTDVPEGLVCKEIPAATYAVFKVGGKFPESMLNTWGQIWQAPLPRTYTADMEIYPADFDPEINPNAEILVAIEKN